MSVSLEVYYLNTALPWPCEMSHNCEELSDVKYMTLSTWKIYFLHPVIIFSIALEHFLCSENDLTGLVSYFWSSKVWRTIDQSPLALWSFLYVIMFPSSSASLSIAYLVRICPCQRSLSTMFIDLSFKFTWPSYYHFITDQALWPNHSPEFIFLFLHPKAKSTVSI